MVKQRLTGYRLRMVNRAGEQIEALEI
jgi:hypothetical protein